LTKMSGQEFCNLFPDDGACAADAPPIGGQGQGQGMGQGMGQG